MIMDIRVRFFTFSGFIFFLFCIFLIQESGARVETINVVDWCIVSSIIKLKNRDTAILKAEENGPLDCRILIDTKPTNTTVVIAFYEYSIEKNDKLVFQDGDGTRLSLSGRGKKYQVKRSFILKGPVRVQYVTNTDRFSSKVKFQFVYSVASDRTCTSEEYKCHNGKCISKSQVCDRYNDCGDRSDEMHCAFDCFYNHFICHNRKCIEGKLVCDGQDDCGDNSDEQDCYRTCNYFEFKCRNHKCVQKWDVCNERNDCGDMSDEENCEVPPAFSTIKPEIRIVKLRRPWLLTIILAAAILAIIVVAFIALLLIRGCVADKNKPTVPTVSGNTNVQQVPPPNFFERIRKSFRSGRQVSALSPLQPSDQRHPQPVAGQQTYEVPSMYPQLPSGVENPVFRTDE